MFARIHKTIGRSYHIVNRIQQTATQPADLKPLFSSKSFENLLPELPDISEKDSIEIISKHQEALNVYNRMVPYNFVSFLSSVSLNWIVHANYIEKLKVLEFYVMDTSGIYKKYVEVDKIIPILYEDLMAVMSKNVPYMELIDTDMIYKHADRAEVFVFDKEGTWNTETANHPDFDFTKLFQETEWIDSQINSGY